MPRKGAFARCVESVESRGGVRDPRGVCAASIGGKRGRTRGRVNPPKHFYKSVERGRVVYYHDWNIGRRLVKYPTAEAELLIATGEATVGPKPESPWKKRNAPKKGKFSEKTLLSAGKALYIAKAAPWALVSNPGKRNSHNERAAIEAYKAFHGREPEEIVEFDTVHHFPGRTSAIGELIELKIKIPTGRVQGSRIVTLQDFGEAYLTEHPTMKQLYVEGGDQSLDLEEFGLSDSDPHEVEYLGELTRCLYYTVKDHLGKDGGEANYDHKFGKNELTLEKTELIKVGYHVPDEQLLFIGGGYEIPPEGIDG